MNRRKFLTSSVMLSAGLLFAKKSDAGITGIFFDDYEEMRCKRMLRALDMSLKDLPMGELVAAVGENFLGTEYIGGTLDKETKTEKLVIMITGLDCVTFVENALVMARLVKLEKADFEDYKKQLTLIRYRNGVIDGYTSRLHYFTDWIFDNQQKGIVEDITQSIGGIPYNKNINFMTSNVSSYKQLENSKTNVVLMKEVETMMNARNMYYIPKQEIDLYYDKLQTGDIIATTTNIAGLDVTHTGFVYKENGGTYFLHASIKTKDVMITNEELKQYLMSNSKQTGVIVARPRELN